MWVYNALFPGVELSPRRHSGMNNMGQCYAKIIFSLRVYEIVLGGMEVLLPHFSQAEVAWIAGKPMLHSRTDAIPMHTTGWISLKTKLRRNWTVHLPWQGNRAKKTGWDISLGWWSASGRESSAGLWDTPGFYCCGGTLQCQIKTAQTLRRSSVSLRSLHYRQVYRGIRQN